LRIALQVFEGLETRVEQTDPGFQNLLEVFNGHWFAGAADALPAYGEKSREM
jgi:hypothetical protein